MKTLMAIIMTMSSFIVSGIAQPPQQIPSVEKHVQVEAGAAVPGGVATAQGTTASGSQWIAEKPANWNGTVLLWSHGYRPSPQRPPEDGPPQTKESLLAKGYALLGSNFSTTGWAVAEAVPDQIAALDAFSEKFGEPKRTIAWGQSMGGLITSDLVEKDGNRLAGALTICASSGGAVGMMNMALDGAYAFVTLVAPDAGIAIVHTQDDMANGRRVKVALDAARQTPQGRARIALAGVLGGLPDWTSGPTAPTDANGRADEMAKAFSGGIFLPRADQEIRAGGVFSWNDGIDYKTQLQKSGRQTFVEHLYKEAGLDLNADLNKLNSAQRVKADSNAVGYMISNFTPGGRISIPVLSMHTIGDGATSPSLTKGYAQIIRDAGHGNLIAVAWNARAGHCTSSGPEVMAGLDALTKRIDTGRWDTSPETLNDLAKAEGDGAPTFVNYDPPPALRLCRAEGNTCAK